MDRPPFPVILGGTEASPQEMSVWGGLSIADLFDVEVGALSLMYFMSVKLLVEFCNGCWKSVGKFRK